jgi:hypothetical protein
MAWQFKHFHGIVAAASLPIWEGTFSDRPLLPNGRADAV